MSGTITISNVTSSTADVGYSSVNRTPASTTITLVVTNAIGYRQQTSKNIKSQAAWAINSTLAELTSSTKYTVKVTPTVTTTGEAYSSTSKTFTTLSDIVTSPVGTVSLSLNGTSVYVILAVSTLGSNPVPSYRLLYGGTSVSPLTITAIGSTTKSLSGFSPGTLATVAAQSSTDGTTWTTFAQNSIRVAPTFNLTSSATCTKIALSVTVASTDTIQYKVIATPSTSTLTAITSDWITSSSSSSSSPTVTTLKNASPGTTYVISCTYTYDSGTTSTAAATTALIATLEVPTLAVSAASSGMKVSWTSSTTIDSNAGISLLVDGVTKGALVGTSGNVFVPGLASNKSYAITVSESS